MIEQGKKNLTHPVRLYAEFAIESARSIDPLYNDSLFAALDKGLSPAERAALVSAKAAAAESLHGYADWLEKKLPSMTAWKPIGLENYQYMLTSILLLPMSAH